MTVTHTENHTVPNHCCTSGADVHTTPTARTLKRSETEYDDCTARTCCLQAPKYVSLIEKIEKRIEKQEHWYSLEFFPPRTASGAANLLGCFERMSAGQPLFCDITWHPAGDPAGTKETSSMMIANAMLNYCSIDTMLHITSYGATKTAMLEYLTRAKEFGIRNLLALRGDPAAGEEWRADGKCDFRYACDLVRFIREHFGDYFVICVAGYPQGHPDSNCYDEDLIRLKEKIDCGADFIITQLFFQAETFLKFETDCRAAGITCPIIPGILPIQGYASLRNIVRLAKLDVPQEIRSCIEPIKDNDEAIRKYGVEICLKLCRDLLQSNKVYGLHFYTLNREVATIEILKKLDLWSEDHSPRALPWKKLSNNYSRCQENVRPIFWSSRPKSYVHRTLNWNEFPNGRWGLSSAPSFGQLNDYHLFYMKIDASREELLEQWGRELRCEEDVWRMFSCYIGREKNQTEKIIRHFPWTDEELSAETKLIQNELIQYNRKGILTINSQPAVNGTSSSDPVVGWGAPNGYIYQKAYLEFFTSEENILALREVLPHYPNVNYHFVNRSGDVNETNNHNDDTIAVTWGVFAGKEVIQPTIVDPVSFLTWKDEAFGLWMERWGNLYHPSSPSYATLERISQTYYLVNLVDNDYPQDSCLWSLLDSMFECREKRKEKL